MIPSLKVIDGKDRDGNDAPEESEAEGPAEESSESEEESEEPESEPQLEENASPAGKRLAHIEEDSQPAYGQPIANLQNPSSFPSTYPIASFPHTGSGLLAEEEGFGGGDPVLAPDFMFRGISEELGGNFGMGKVSGGLRDNFFGEDRPEDNGNGAIAREVDNEGTVCVPGYINK